MRNVFLLLIALSAMGGAQAPPFFVRDMLAGHNAVRARLGIAPLKWSSQLAARAQQWADTLITRHQFAHSRSAAYGENLYEIRGAYASPAEVVNAWAAEARDYDYKSNRCRGMCGHYTQIVWRDTKELGCAMALGQDREVWVCEYSPPGNWVGKRPY